MPVAAIILAAGASRRLGQPKQLVPVDGEPLLARALRLAKEAGAEPVIAVLGAHAELIRPAISFDGAVLVVNDRWQQGMATSIHAGLHALATHAPESDAALILACDQPRLTADHLRSLLAVHAAKAEPSIVASAYAGTTGTPAIFPRQVFPRLLALRGDKGARALLADPPCPLIAVPFEGGEIDIDLPSDLERLR